MRMPSRIGISAFGAVLAVLELCCGGGAEPRRANAVPPTGYSSPHSTVTTCSPGTALPAPVSTSTWDPASLPYPLNLSYEQIRPLIAQLPCPLPGLPPALAAKVDCSIVRQRATGARYEPLPIPVGDPYATVDHRWDGIAGPVRDQGQVGSCHSNAMASVLDAYGRRRGRPDASASALHIFSSYAPASQAGLTPMKHQDGTLFISAESVWPYDPQRACSFASTHDSGCGSDYRMQAGWAVGSPQFRGERAYADSRPVFRAREVSGFPIDDPNTVNEIAKYVMGGRALQVAFDMPLNWSSDDTQVSCDGTLPFPSGYYGAHALVVQGYRYTPRGRQFLIQNSWGRKWGDMGLGWVDESVFRQRLVDVILYEVAFAWDPPGFDPNFPKLVARPGLSVACPGGMTMQNGVCVPNVGAIPVCAAGQWPTFAAPCLPGVR